MAKKLTYEEFIYRAKNIHKDKYNYSLITKDWWQENYKHNQKTKIPIICKNHGLFYQTVFDHLQGHGCLNCVNKQKWTKEKIINDLKKFNLKFIKIIDNKNLNKKRKSLAEQYLKYECKTHGIQQGKVRNVCKNGCKLCSIEKNKNKNRKNNLIFWQNRIKNFKLLINEKEFNQIYTNAQKTKVKAQCLNCGKIHYRTLFHLWQKGTCSCTQNNLMTFERAYDKLINLNTKYNYSLITKEWWQENYKGKYKTKIPIICLEHGIFWQRFSDHINGAGCPKCKESKGERKIRQILEKNNINYLTEYFVPESKLRFDFFLPDFNIAIEYDGIQHFKNIKINSLIQTKQRDFLKNRLCHIHKINLIRISYHNFKNLEQTLEYIFKREKIRRYYGV